MAEQNPQKLYIVQRQGFPKADVWDEEKFNRSKDRFFNDFKEDGFAYEMSPLTQDYEIQDNDTFVVRRKGFPKADVWDAEKMRRSGQRFMQDFPDAEITRATPVDYWGDKLAEQYDRRTQLEEELQGLPSVEDDIPADPRAIPGSSVMASQSIMQERREAPERQRRTEIKRELDQIGLDIENNPAWQRYWQHERDDATESLARVAQMKRDAKQRIAEGDSASLLDPEILDATRALYEDALKTASAPSRYNGAEGLDEAKQYVADMWRAAKENKWSAVSMLDTAKALRLGANLIPVIQQIQAHEGDNANLLELSKTPENLTYLSDPERELLRAFVKKAEVESGRADNISMGYQAGQSAIQSLGFMGDFFLLGGIGEAGARKVVGDKIANLATDAVVETSLKKIGAETLHGLVKAAVMTPLMPSTYTNIVNNILQFNDEGGIDLSGKAVLSAVGDDFIETISETIGSEPLKLLGWGVGKALPTDWLSKTSFGAWGRALRHSPIFNVMKQAGWNGFVEEMFEEVTGNALRVATGIDKDALKEFAKPEQLLITATSFAPMSLVGGSLTTVQYTAASVKMRNDGVALEEVLKASGMDPNAIRQYVDQRDANSPVELASSLSDAYEYAVNNGQVSPEVALKAVQDYAKSVSRYKVLEGIYDQQQDIDRVNRAMEISQQVGSEKWYHEGADKERFVRTFTGRDGSVYYYVSETQPESETDKEGNLVPTPGKSILAVGQDGTTKFIYDNELADGTYQDSGEMPINTYLDNAVIQQKQVREQARMEQEVQENNANLIQRAQPGAEVNLGTVENPVRGIIQGVQGGRYIVAQVDENGNAVSVSDYSPEEMAAKLDIPFAPMTDREIEQQDVERMQRIDEQTKKVNAVGSRLPLDNFHVGIPNGSTFGRIIKMDDGRLRLFYEGPDGKAAMRDLDEGSLDELSRRADTLPAEAPMQEETAEVAETPVEDNTPRDFRGNPLPMRTNKRTGQQVVDENALWNKDPEAWARWNDDNPNQRVTSKERLEDQIKDLEKQIEKDTQAVHNAALKGIDADKMDDMEYSLAQKIERRNLLSSILDRYNKPAAAGPTIAGEQRKAAAEQTIAQQQAGFPGIQQKWDNAPKVVGAADEIRLANGETISGHYVLTEATAPTPSHDPANGFAMTEGFPVDENGKTVNDRDYEHDKDAQQAVMEKAKHYDQRALQTPVIVSSDGVVLSGNDRTMAGQIAAYNGWDNAYVAYLAKYPQKYGFTAERVGQFRSPRVVFVPDAAMPYDAATFAKFNAEDKKSQSKTEKAVKAGKTLTPETLGTIASLVDRYDDINALYNDADGVNELLDILLAAEVITPEQIAALKDGERLSGTGMDLLESTLIGAALDEEAVRIAMEDANIRKSVVSAIAQIIVGNTLAEYNLRAELTDAIQLVASGKRAKEIKFGESVQSYIRQQHLFEEDVVAEATVQMLADAINDRKPSFLKKVLSLYNRDAVDSASGQLNLLTGDILTREAILRNILEYLGYDTNIIFDTSEREAERRAAAAEQPAGPAAEAGPAQQNDAPVQSDAGSTVEVFPRESAAVEFAEILGSEYPDGTARALAEAMSDEEIAEYTRLRSAFDTVNDQLGEAYTRLEAAKAKDAKKAAKKEVNDLEVQVGAASEPMLDYVRTMLEKYGFEAESYVPASEDAEMSEDAVADEVAEEMEDEFEDEVEDETEDEDEEPDPDEPKPDKGRKGSKKSSKKAEAQPYVVKGGASEATIAKQTYTQAEYEEFIYGYSTFTLFESKKTGEQVQIYLVDDTHPIYHDHRCIVSRRLPGPNGKMSEGGHYTGQHTETHTTTDYLIKYLKANKFKPVLDAKRHKKPYKNKYGFWVNQHGVVMNPIRIELPSVKKGWANSSDTYYYQDDSGKWFAGGSASHGTGGGTLGVKRGPYDTKSAAIRATIDALESFRKAHPEKNTDLRDVDNLIRTLKTKTLPQAMMEEGALNNVPRAEITASELDNGVQGLLFGEEGQTAAPAAAEEKPKRKRTSKKKAETPAASVEETPVEDSEEETEPKFVLEDEEGTPGNFHWVSERVCTNPQIITIPGNDRLAAVPKVVLAEKDGKWYNAVYVTDDTGKGSSWGSVEPTFKSSYIHYDSREEAIKQAIEYIRFLLNDRARKNGVYGETFNKAKELVDYLVMMELPKKEDTRIAGITEALKAFDNARGNEKTRYVARLMKDVGDMLDFADDDLNAALKSAAERFRTEQLSEGIDSARARYVRRVRQALKDATGNKTMTGYGEMTEAKPTTRKPAARKAETKPAAPAYGSQNKLITTDQYEDLKRRMKEKLGQLNAGFDPETFFIGAQMAMYHVEAGARKFIDFSQRMIREVGDGIRPYLKAIYNGARDLPGMEDLRKEMDSAADVDAINVDSIAIDYEDWKKRVKEGDVYGNERVVMVDRNSAGGAGMITTEFLDSGGRSTTSMPRFYEQVFGETVQEEPTSEPPQGGERQFSGADTEIQGLEGLSTLDVYALIEDHIDKVMGGTITQGFNGFSLVDMIPIGSRAFGTAREDSDLDILLEYEGDAKEDAVFNVLNGEPLEIMGIKVDFFPIRAQESGTLTSWLASHDNGRPVEKEQPQAGQTNGREDKNFPTLESWVEDCKENFPAQFSEEDRQSFMKFFTSAHDYGLDKNNVEAGNRNVHYSTLRTLFPRHKFGFWKWFNKLEDDAKGKERSQVYQNSGNDENVSGFDYFDAETNTLYSMQLVANNHGGGTIMRASYETYRQPAAEQEERLNEGDLVVLKDRNRFGGVLKVVDVHPSGSYDLEYNPTGVLPVIMKNVGSDEIVPMVRNHREDISDMIQEAREETNTNPTDAQKKAGNYKHGHITLDGYDISIENPKGSLRSGKDANGKKWSVTMNNDYGYIRMTEGVDGDHIDVFLSDNPAEGNVFVVDQVNPDSGEFDEHKVMYGFNSAQEARDAYLANYSPGWKGLGIITEVSKDEFKKWVESSHRKTKPFSEYKSVNALGGQSEASGQLGELGKYTHTKTGREMTIVRLTGDRLSADEFKALKARARELGGYYSSYGNAKGFLFENEEDAIKFNTINTTQNVEERTDVQTAADSAAISSEAAAVVSEARSLAESANPDEREVAAAVTSIDATLDAIDDQLALLGYYEADQTGPFHESYGYMKSAEKKAVKDADRLAKKLAADLGIDVGRKTLAKANIAPAGGDITFRLPLPLPKKGTSDYMELYVDIKLDVTNGDDLQISSIAYPNMMPSARMDIMYRLEDNGQMGLARFGTNYFAPYNVTYADLLKAIRSVAKDYIRETQPGPVDVLQVAKEQAEKSRKSKKKFVSSQEDGDAVLGGLFDTLAEAEDIAFEVEETPPPAARVKPTEVNGYAIGEKVLYTPDQGDRKHQEATIYDFEYDGRPVLDTGLAPVLYEVVEWNQIQKIETEPVNDTDNGLPRNDELRTEGLPADGSGQQQGVQRGTPEESGGPGQESGRADREGEGGREGDVHGRTRALRPRYDDSVKRNTRNYRRAKGDEIPKTVAARFKANIAAIRLLKELQDSGKQATKEQMDVLRQYTGWGGLGGYFNNEYSPEYRELRSLLTDDELQAAALSINTAYYTPTEIIESMWDIAKRLGFEGGNVLEGSAGIGNILASMPKNISERSAITAVELDNITGGILQQLYPDANVQIKGFQEVDVPNGSVDLAITNVPFGDINVYDSKEKDLTRKFGGKIHDFCIAKNIRKLSEGGIGIFISTRGTLDGSSKALRQWIVNEGGADVIGAFRLNNATFEGTKATSDIIVVRKRVNGHVSSNAINVTDTEITRRVDYQTNETEWNKNTRTWEPITGKASMEINAYFVEHPENMGGEMGFGFEHNDTYRPGSSALWPSEKIDQNKRLAKWAKQFSSMQEEVAPTASETENVAEEANATKEGQLLTNSKGEICISRSGKAVPIAVNALKVKGYTKAQVLADYDALKSAINEVLNYQLNNESDEGLKPLIDKLNRAYDRFARRYDRLNRNTAISFLRYDVDFPSIAAIEDYKEKKGIDGKVKIEVKKTSIFSGRVLGAKRIPTPADAKDGVIVSINQFGRIDIPFIAQALNKDEEAVREEILASGLGFENPVTGNVEVEYEYLSGNVREKLEYARAHNADGKYDKNVEALEKVIPADIPAHLIEFSLGSDWMPVELYTEYAKEKFGVNDNFVPTMAGGSWILPENTWEMEVNTEKNRAAGVRSEKLRTDKKGHELMLAAMNNTSVVFSRTYKDSVTGETITEHDKEATQAATTKMSEMRDDFKEWCKAKMLGTPELAERIAKIYNDTFNAIVPKEIRETFIPEHFEGMATRLNNGKPLNLRLHQAKAVIRATTEPLMMAHEVGTGKTFTLIATAMEMRRLGTAKKPMIVVQNATLGQFVSSAKELYPNAKILTISEADRTVEGRSAFYAKIKYNDWDMIVVPQSVFEMIPDSEERQRAFIQEKIDEKKFILAQVKEAKNSTAERQLKKELEDLEYEYQYGEKPPKKGRGGKKDAKKEAEAVENAVAKAKKQLDRRTDDVADFDDMGIDALLIDEAHSYKHLGFSTAMQRGVKGVDATGSKKSAGVYLKTRSVFDKVGWKNVVFATGTPISNTAAEMWTFMKYLMPADVMRQHHIYYFDDFVRNFGNISQSLEFTTSGKFKETTRFASYTNLPELIRIWSSVTDTVRSKDAVAEGDEKLEDKQPKMEGGQARDIYLPQSPSLVDIMNAVRAKLEWYEGLSGKEKKENSHIPLTMFGIAKMAAIDPRLVDRDAQDEPTSKTNKAVEETLQALKDSKKYNGTCALFCDNFRRWDTDGSGKRVEGFNIFEEIKRKLVAAGVPDSQIVIMKSGMNTAAKEKIFARVNSGEVRVIMGTTATLGTGVNIQERLFFEAHLDAPNRPMDYTQRNGRILRQGNLHKEWGIPVRVVRFGVEDSLDVTAYQRLSTKAKFIDSIMNGRPLLANGMDNRVLEEEEEGEFDNPVAILSGSQYALLKSQAERELRKLRNKKEQHRQDQIYIERTLKANKSRIEYDKKLIDEANGNLAKVKSAFPDGSVKEVTIEGRKAKGAEQIAEAIRDKITTPLRARLDSRRIERGFTEETLNYAMSFDGVPVNIKVYVERLNEYDEKRREYRPFMRTRVEYSIPRFGVEDRYVQGGYLAIKDIVSDFMESFATGRYFEEGVKGLTNTINRLNADNELMLQRRGKPFADEDKLDKQEEIVKDYTEKMRAELAEKEAKYAEMAKNAKPTFNVDNVEVDEDNEGEETSAEYADDYGNGYLSGIPDRQDGEDAKTFTERVVHEMLERYPILKGIVSTSDTFLSNLTPEEQDKRQNGHFNSRTKKITIFAKENKRSADGIARTVIHEAIHWAIDALGWRKERQFINLFNLSLVMSPYYSMDEYRLMFSDLKARYEKMKKRAISDEEAREEMVTSELSQLVLFGLAGDYLRGANESMPQLGEQLEKLFNTIGYEPGAETERMDEVLFDEDKQQRIQAAEQRAAGAGVVRDASSERVLRDGQTAGGPGGEEAVRNNDRKGGDLDEDGVSYELVSDPETIQRLEQGDKGTGYRNVVQNADGSLGSPMAGKLGRRGAASRATSPFFLNRWEQAEENPDMATEDGKINLIKPQGRGNVDGVDYNPYIHIRPTTLNRQFTQAWRRPELVYVETAYPASELESGYKAEKAKLSVGRHPWNGGELILSRYDKPTRIVPWDEVAEEWVREYQGTGVTFDIVPPGLLPVLAGRGVEILPPKKAAGQSAMDAYNQWRSGVRNRVGYHGSLADFDAFDINHAGEGEGFQSHGFGHYIALDRNTGVGYAWSNAFDKADKEGKIEPEISEILRNDSFDDYDSMVKRYDELLAKRKKDVAKELAAEKAEKTPDMAIVRTLQTEQENLQRYSSLQKIFEGTRNVYTVEIPDDTGDNYIDEMKTLAKSGRRRIAEVVRNQDASLLQTAKFGPNWLPNGLETLANVIEREQLAGLDLRRRLSAAFGSEKEASRIMHEAGFVGIKYDGRSDGPCVVIFSNDDIRIVGHERFREGTESIPSPVRYSESMSAKRLSASETASKCGIEIEFRPSSQMQFNGKPLAGRWINGKMYICLEHCRDAADAVRTVLHEGVGHNGLRRLVGSENMTAFCLDMFRRLPADTRREIAGAAVTKYGGNIAEATEEYLAERAEVMDFENEDYERSFWDIVLDGLRMVLAKVGIDIPLSQRDVRWLMWQSYNANKQTDVLNEAKRQVVARKLGFTLRQQADKAEGVQMARNRLAEEELAPAARIYNKDVLYWANRLHETWVDKDDSVHRLVSAIEKATGKSAAAFEDIRLALNQQSSKGLAAIENFERKFWEPMQAAIRALMTEKGCDLHAIERYVMIKHGLERNEVFAKRDARAYYQDLHDTNVAAIENSDKIDDVTRLQLVAKEDAKLKKNLDAVDAGTDVKYKELRKQDYGGLTAMYSEWDAIEPFMEGVESEEEYQARVLRARHPKYTYMDENGREQVDMAATEEAAMKEVEEFEKGSDRSVEELWKRINAATKHTLKHQYDANMMSREQYNQVKDMFKYYVPLRGFADNTAEDMYDYYRSDQRNDFTPPLLKAKGRKTEAESPFGYIGSMASSGIAADMKNETKLALYYFVSNRAANDLVSISEVWYQNTGIDEVTGKRIFTPVYPPFKEDLSSADAKKAYEDWEKQMQEEAKAGFAFKGTRKLNLHNSVIHIDKRQEASHVIKFKVGGRDMMMYINGNPRAAQAINNELNVEMSADYQKVFGKILRWFSGINTSYNPEFWLSNAQRDALFALMSVNVKEDSEYGRAFRKNFGRLLRDTLTPGKKGGAYSLKRKLDSGKLGNERLDKFYAEFVENGGVTGYTTLKNNEEWELELRKYTGQEKQAMKAVKTAFEVVQDFGEAIEQMTRFAAYMTSREQGKEIKDAVNDAKELTVNFNRKGSGKAITFKEATRLRTKDGKKLTGVQKAFVVAASWLPVYGRRFIMFFNASVQGLNAMYKLFKKNPARMGTWAAGYLALGVVNAVLHAMLDDDDDYLDIPDYERRNNLLLGAKGVYFKWALPQEARVFYGIGDMAVNHIMGRTPHRSIVSEILASASDIAPLNPAGGLSALAPSAVVPIVEVALNRDYKGAKIYNDMRYLSDEEKKRTPKYTMAYQGTGKPYILLSQFANWLTGGDYADAGWLNINPASVEHLIEGATGGAGTTIEKTLNFVGNTVGGEFQTNQTPFLRRLFTVTDDRYRNAHTTELFDYYKAEAEHTKKLMRQYAKNGDNDKLNKLLGGEDYEIMTVYESYKGMMDYYYNMLKITDDKNERKALMREQDAVRKEMIMKISEIGN